MITGMLGAGIENKTENNLLYMALLVVILIHFVLLGLGETVYGYGGADNVTHYQIAKNAFKHPELFLNLWGKPVYTTLLAPFTLGGYKAAKAFNLLVAVCTLVYSSKISNRLYPGSRLFTILLIAFAPVYFQITLSCLTEVLFSFVLVLAVYWFVCDKFPLSAAVLSFIPFVRSEGVILLPIFALALMLERSYRSVWLLALGALLYGVIGCFVFSDFLWFIHRQPYSLGASIYGNGELFHFVKESGAIFGLPLTALTLAGLFLWVGDIGRQKTRRSKETSRFVIITGSWFLYLSAHSYVWWKGMGGSLGLIRVIGGVIPLAALTAMKTFEFAQRKLKKETTAYTIFSVFAILQMTFLFTQNPIRLKAGPTEKLIQKSAEYIRCHEEGEKVFYFNPLLIHFLKIDPYDVTQCNSGVANKKQPSRNMASDDLLVWDAHFGPNEGGVQLSDLENDPDLKKIKSFYPIEKMTVLGGHDYCVQIFQKISVKEHNGS